MLLCPCLRITCSFFGLFSRWIVLSHSQSTSTDHGGSRTSNLTTERRRHNHFITAPQIFWPREPYNLRILNGCHWEKFGPIRRMFPFCSNHDSTLFDPAQPMTWPMSLLWFKRSLFSSVSVWAKNRSSLNPQWQKKRYKSLPYRKSDGLTYVKNRLSTTILRKIL